LTKAENKFQVPVGHDLMHSHHPLPSSDLQAHEKFKCTIILKVVI
jgi:hypothetical protein